MRLIFLGTGSAFVLGAVLLDADQTPPRAARCGAAHRVRHRDRDSHHPLGRRRLQLLRGAKPMHLGGGGAERVALAARAGGELGDRGHLDPAGHSARPQRRATVCAVFQ